MRPSETENALDCSKGRSDPVNNCVYDSPYLIVSDVPTVVFDPERVGGDMDSVMVILFIGAIRGLLEADFNLQDS